MMSGRTIELKALRCKRCGGELDRDTLRCPYCGTYHMIDEKAAAFDVPLAPPPLIVIDRPGAKVLTAAMMVRNEELAHSAYNADCLRAYVKHSLAAKLAEVLEPEMQLEIEDDPFREGQIVRGRIRILDSKFRF